ncbi:MAG: GC-type dockerin domain-anchored protein [Thiotrichales bacterium]
MNPIHLNQARQYSRTIFNPLLAGLLVSTLTPTNVFANPHNKGSALGVNLPELARWGTDWPFIDEMKRAVVYTQTNSIWDTGELGKVDFDANGWPRSLTPTAGQTATFTKVSYLIFGRNYAALDQPAPPVTEMQVFYDGQGTLAYSNGASKIGSCGTRCDRISVTPSALPLISITATNPSDYLRNIQVIWPGGICNGDIYTWHRDASSCAGSYQSFAQIKDAMLFHPAFLNDLKHYRTLRYMNWQHTNVLTTQPAGSDAQMLALPEREWADRLTPQSATWVDADRGGVPVEVMVDLANTLEAEPWFNLHMLSSNSLVQSFANLVRNRLAADKIVYVELGNETWNSGFKPSRWSEAKGKQFWPSVSDTYSVRMQWFAKRSSEVCAIWKQAWGADSHRVRCVMGAQAANSWVSDNYLLQCPLWKNDARNPGGSNCASNMDALAIAPYFGDGIGQNANYSALQYWAGQGDAGVNKIFDEINEGGVMPSSTPGGALAQSAQWMQNQANVAGQFGLKLIAYEGGQHVVGVNGPDGNADINRLFRDVNRSHKMIAAYTRNLDDWKAAGGELMAMYHSVGPSDRYGSWGLSEYQNQLTPPKKVAVLNWLATNTCWWSGCGAGSAPHYPDADNDGIKDFVDNCSALANANQRDTDRDGYGNVCDADLNGDGIVNGLDLVQFRQRFLTNDPHADFNGDGTVNGLDLVMFRQRFLVAPGPSGLRP